MVLFQRRQDKAESSFGVVCSVQKAVQEFEGLRAMIYDVTCKISVSLLQPASLLGSSNLVRRSPPKESQSCSSSSNLQG